MSKTKIGTIVKSCNDCKFSKVFKEEGNNSEYLFVCTFSKPSILEEYSTHPHHSDKPIPDTCPLDDYTGDNKNY